MIDATPLLLRSAGVKNYFYYWVLSIQQFSATDRIRLFPINNRFSQLDHERSIYGSWSTAFGTLLVNFCNIRYNRALDLLAGGFDIFHASQHVRNPPRSVKLTATIHDMTCWLLPGVHTRENIDATRQYADRVLRRSSACIAVSESTRRDAIEILKLDEDRITVIYPGVSEKFFFVPAKQIAAVAKRYGLAKPYILFVSVIEPRKNVSRLLDVYAALPEHVRADYDLVIAGPFGWCDAELRARLLRPAKGVRYLGYVPEADLPGLTAGAKLFFYPSLYEGFGFPVAQAMACGIPVITSRGSSLEEIGGGDVLLVDPHSVEEMAAAVEKLALRTDLLYELGQRGRGRAARYHWDRCAGESLEFFRTA